MFVDCKPVDLAVADIDAEGEDVVTGEAIRNAAEARLRSARMYDRQAVNTLYINFNVAGPAFALKVEFYKSVVDEYGNGGLGVTWAVGSFGAR